MARLLVECAVRGTLVAAVTAVILWATRIKTPAAVHAAWTGVLLSMLLLPVWTMWGPRASMRVLPPVPSPREIVTTPPAAVREAPQAERRRSDTVDSVTAHSAGLGLATGLAGPLRPGRQRAPGAAGDRHGQHPAAGS